MLIKTFSTEDLFNLYMEQFTFYTKIIRKLIKVVLGALELIG